jgi:hypothetical protein
LLVALSSRAGSSQLSATISTSSLERTRDFTKGSPCAVEKVPTIHFVGKDASGILQPVYFPFTLEVITIQDGVECPLGLRQVVKGVGGERKITAKFPEGTASRSPNLRS